MLLDVYHKVEWDLAQVDRQAQAEDYASPTALDAYPYQTYDAGTNTAPEALENTQTNEAGEEEGGPQNTLVMNLRSAKYPTAVRIVTRKTTKAQKVLAGYLDIVGEDKSAFDLLGTSAATGAGRGRGKGKATNPSAKTLKLSFDGEELTGDAQVGDLDAEDSDAWDVIGL
jgi:hypothetical protein